MDKKLDRLPRAVDIARKEAKRNANVTNRFSIFASSASQVLGSALCFAGALIIILVWAATGPLYHFSDTWQLIINTGTTVVTFLMVFLIQNTQNRDAKAIHLKLNEIVFALHKAHNELIDVEKLSDEELKALDSYYARVRRECERRTLSSAESNMA
jgi:low affinity Fe/Cu permease